MESSGALLDSATRLFGEQGYHNTSLEDIAADCQLTLRPIYHYFGNKKSLFAAVNKRMEQRMCIDGCLYRSCDDRRGRRRPGEHQKRGRGTYDWPVDSFAGGLSLSNQLLAIYDLGVTALFSYTTST
ncbi:MAG: helix-turn-helix domain-containing protein [Halieaceae bacterium]